MSINQQLSSASILLVDSSKDWSNIVRQLLIGLRVSNIHDVYTAKMAFEALKIHKFDLIVVDFDLEPDDGITFVEQVRKLEKEAVRALPIIMMCQQITYNNVIEAIRVGANELISKPISRDKMGTCLLSVLKNPRQIINVVNYFGPDRRRLKTEFTGNERRA